VSVCSLPPLKLCLHTRVVSTIDGTVLGTGSAVRASRCVPRVAIEAVRVSVDNVSPAPVGVEDNGARLVGAALTTCASTSLPGQLGVSLCLLFADLLSASGPEKEEGSDDECLVHRGDRERVCCWMSKDFRARESLFISRFGGCQTLSTVH